MQHAFVFALEPRRKLRRRDPKIGPLLDFTLTGEAWLLRISARVEGGTPAPRLQEAATVRGEIMFRKGGF